MGYPLNLSVFQFYGSGAEKGDLSIFGGSDQGNYAQNHLGTAFSTFFRGAGLGEKWVFGLPGFPGKFQTGGRFQLQLE